MNGVSKREKTHETSFDMAKSARERERMRERVTRRGVQQSLAESDRVWECFIYLFFF